MPAVFRKPSRRIGWPPPAHSCSSPETISLVPSASTILKLRSGFLYPIHQPEIDCNFTRHREIFYLKLKEQARNDVCIDRYLRCDDPGRGRDLGKTRQGRA